VVDPARKQPISTTIPKMSSGGQRSSSSGGSAESVAAGCSLRELRPKPRQRNSPGDMEGLAVFTFGRGEDGQLGLGDTCDSDEPKFVDALRGVGVRQIACGSGHTVVLTTDGEVYTWGALAAKKARLRMKSCNFGSALTYLSPCVCQS
jgi:hypothetical protein